MNMETGNMDGEQLKELHKEVVELHLRKRQIIDFKGKEAEW